VNLCPTDSDQRYVRDYCNTKYFYKDNKLCATKDYYELNQNYKM